jgi:CHASE3 domain sensor protein
MRNLILGITIGALAVISAAFFYGINLHAQVSRAEIVQAFQQRDKFLTDMATAIKELRAANKPAAVTSKGETKK